MPTSIRAEGAAIALALDWAAEQKEPSDITIRTDSMHWVTSINEYIPMWMARGDNMNDHANPDLTMRIWQAVKKVRADGKFTISHVRAHKKDESFDSIHNNLADALANLARSNDDFMVRATLHPNPSR
jgi:ribonuclease HI